MLARRAPEILESWVVGRWRSSVRSSAPLRARTAQVIPGWALRPRGLRCSGHDAFDLAYVGRAVEVDLDRAGDRV